MTHLAEGTLQAYLDDEITGRDRASAAEHLLVCGECRVELDALRRANALLRDALAGVDVPAPAAAPRAGRIDGRRAFGGSSLMRAAILVLMVAAAASASVPGSPVREWIVQTVRPAEPPQPVLPESPVAVESPIVEVPAAPAGIAMPGIRSVDVVVTGLTGASIRLIRTEATGVAVSARGGSTDPVFRLASGRIEVVGGVGGDLVVEVPRTGASVRLVVEGRRYAEAAGAELRVIEPAEARGDTVVWP